MFLLIALALSDTRRCNEYFCYNQNDESKELELVGLAENFIFSIYGMMNSKPLNLDPHFNDGSTLTSINFNFPPSYYSMKMSIPSTVKYIKPEAFLNVERVSINLTLGEGAFVGDRAFEGCTSLKTITFIGDASKIGAGAFKGCTGLQSISELKVAEIGIGAFANCFNLKGELKISSITKAIGDDAFSYCLRLSGDLTIPESVILVGKSAFDSCSGLNGTLTIESSATEIMDNAFFGTKLSKLVYPGKIDQEILNHYGLPENIVIVEPSQKKFVKFSLLKNSESESSEKKLSTGAKVAIVFSVLAIVAFVTFAVIFIVKKIKSQKNYQEI